MMRLMPSKFDLIRRLKGKRVLDLGGVGYSGNKVRDKILADAWNGVVRTVLDVDPKADVVLDLNQLPLPDLKGEPLETRGKPLETRGKPLETRGRFDVAVAFDVLEHLKHPALVLEWIPADELWLNVPTATSLLCQKIERECHKKTPDFRHLFSFNMITVVNLVESCGWQVVEKCYTLDRQSWRGELFNRLASLVPYWMSMGITLHCVREKKV